MNDKIKISAPATIANLSCGFDALGLALEHVSDIVEAEKTTELGCRILSVEGAELPTKEEENVLTVAANALLKKINADFGISFKIKKCIRPGSGLGSSAASAAAGAVAANYFSGNELPAEYLIPFAMEGEYVASKGYHADNIAPALMGGITLISNNSPVVVSDIPAPDELFFTCVFQHVTVKTSEAREAIPSSISTKDAIEQAKNFATLMSGLYQNNFHLIAQSQTDLIAEPYRKGLIPNFDELTKVGLEAGAFSSGISGSGPTIYFMSKGKENAQKVKKEIDKLLETKAVSFESVCSPVAREGAKIIAE